MVSHPTSEPAWWFIDRAGVEIDRPEEWLPAFIEINIEPTILTASTADISLQGSTTDIIPEIVNQLKILET